MRVTEQGDPVRQQKKGLPDRLRDALLRLTGEPVKQIEIERCHATGSHPLRDRAGLRETLLPVDRLLDLGRKILSAKTRPRPADRAEGIVAPVIHITRIEFHAYLGIQAQIECPAQFVIKRDDIGGSKNSG